MMMLMTAFRVSLLMLVLCGLVYPIVMTGVGQAFFPSQANGSLLHAKNGQLIGSKLIGQSFKGAQYFHSRPAANSYDASNSGGANLGASSQKLITRIQGDLKTYQTETITERAIPVDAVTASASSLDPHISLDNALLQATRVAKARGISLAKLKSNIMNSAESPLFAEFPYINVLTLNIELDKATP